MRRPWLESAPARSGRPGPRNELRGPTASSSIMPAVDYYKHHIFFCCNQRENGARCCNDSGATAVRDYAKSRVKELKLSGPGKVRVNMAGCLDRCDEGPVIVVYPEGVW